jgi:hypothetical protein
MSIDEIDAKSKPWVNFYILLQPALLSADDFFIKQA